MRSAALTGVVIVFVVSIGLMPAAAQDGGDGSFASASRPANPGWSVTPSVMYGFNWDDNVLARGRGDSPQGDFLNVVNPRGQVDFAGRRGQLSAGYDGAFLLYRQLDALNSLDQHTTFFGRRLLTPHLAVFARNTTAVVPTTELAELVGIPYLRTGSRLEDAHGGVEAALSRHTTIVASYQFQWLKFDHDATFADQLNGGHSQGGTFSLRQAISTRTAIIGDYYLQHAIIAGDGGTFTVQNASAGVEQRLTETWRLFASGGFSRLGVTSFGPARTGPAWHVGATRQFETAAFDISYSRSFVPTFTFGGTVQNEEVTSRLRLPIGRRLYTQSSLSWRRNDPLVESDLHLTSLWVGGTVGYALHPWLRLEGFYDNLSQETDVAGGHLDRNRIGFQVISARPMRIR